MSALSQKPEDRNERPLGCDVPARNRSPAAHEEGSMRSVVRTIDSLARGKGKTPVLCISRRFHYNLASMELDQLRSFAAVAEARSFTRASALVHLSQPAISRQISSLEKELGAELFERYGRRVELTANGELLLPLARSIVARADEAARLVRENVGMVSSRVRFGSSGIVFAHMLPSVLASFVQAYPKIHLDLIEREDSLSEEAVANGEIDCAIVTGWGSPRATVVRLLTEEIFLVVPQGHRLAERTSVALSELANEPLLLPGHTLNMANHLTDACHRAGFEPRVPHRVNYLELSKVYARQGMGVSLIPRMGLDPRTLDGLVVIPFEERLTRDLNLIYSREHAPSAATRVLIVFLRANVTDGFQASRPAR
jgi:LysR family transcriptional regulator, transcription activator of glutamate synthase operon